MAIAAVLLAAGCGSSDPDAQDAAGPGDTAQAKPPASGPASPTASGNPSGRLRALPDTLKFEATTLDGKAFKGADLAERPVVFWFWAPWCPKCMSEGPAVAETARKYQGKVAFVGVAGLDGSKDRMRAFVSRTGTEGFAHLDDRTGKVYKHFRVTSQSSYVFLGRDGGATRATGPLDAGELERHISRIHG